MNMYSNKKIRYFQYRLISKKNKIDKNKNYIDTYAKLYDVNKKELYGILLIEHMNRGNVIIRLIEKALVKYFTHYVIKKDLSVGLAQIKISTAQRYYPTKDVNKLTHELIKDEFSIMTCARIISDYYKKNQLENKLLGLVKEYTTGDVESYECDSIKIYYQLLKWIVKEI